MQVELSGMLWHTRTRRKSLDGVPTIYRDYDCCIESLHSFPSVCKYVCWIDSVVSRTKLVESVVSRPQKKWGRRVTIVFLKRDDRPWQNTVRSSMLIVGHHCSKWHSVRRKFDADTGTFVVSGPSTPATTVATSNRESTSVPIFNRNDFVDIASLVQVKRVHPAGSSSDVSNPWLLSRQQNGVAGWLLPIRSLVHSIHRHLFSLHNKY